MLLAVVEDEGWVLALLVLFNCVLGGASEQFLLSVTGSS